MRRYTFKTLESNDKLITRKPKNIIEADEKKIKSKKILSLNYDITPLNKYYKTELSFKNTTNILLKDNKLEKKSFNNKSNIISIDRMKNANKVINRKKKIEKILNHSNQNIGTKYNNQIKHSKNMNLNINLKRIKEKKEDISLKNNANNKLLKSKELNISKEKDPNSISSSDLGEVGELIEDEGESEFGNELNELNENNLINNPKSINTYSSPIILISNKENKRISLSVNKFNSNNNYNYNYGFSSPIKKNIMPISNEKISYNFKNSKEIFDMIKKKENDIEKIKKAIEIVKRNIKYYDKEIIEVEKFIQNQEQTRNFYQILINYLNMK